MVMKLGISDIAADIKDLSTTSSYAPVRYASLLRIILSPSQYDLTDEALTAAVTALRQSESNHSYKQIYALLQELAPLT